MLTLILIRHGETALNAERRYQGRLDPPLSPRGIRQASDLAGVLSRTLAAEPAGPAAIVYSSDRARARATAALALPDASVTLDPRLRELDFGAYDGRTYEENLEAHGDSFLAWLEDPRATRPPGGETLAELEARIVDWLSALPAAGCVVAFTHGGPMHALLSRLLRLPFAAARRWEVAPGDGLRLVLPADRHLRRARPAAEMQL